MGSAGIGEISEDEYISLKLTENLPPASLDLFALQGFPTLIEQLSESRTEVVQKWYES